MRQEAHRAVISASLGRAGHQSNEGYHLDGANFVATPSRNERSPFTRAFHGLTHLSRDVS